MKVRRKSVWLLHLLLHGQPVRPALQLDNSTASTRLCLVWCLSLRGPQDVTTVLPCHAHKHQACRAAQGDGACRYEREGTRMNCN
jgi:hypothetical protein